MMQEGKAHMQQLSKMLAASDEVMRHMIMKERTVSTWYKVRAMSDSMLTVKPEWDKVQEGNAYHYMYGAHIEGGKCSCGSGEQETMQHIYGECKHTDAVRVKAVQKASKLWPGKAQRYGEARLLEIDYFTKQGASMSGGTWQQWWRWMGLVPKEVRGKVGLGEVKLVLATAKILAEAGRDIWDARNEEQ